MRSEGEIAAALRHLEEVTGGSDKTSLVIIRATKEALLWVLEHPSKFGPLFVDPCNALDAAKDN